MQTSNNRNYSPGDSANHWTSSGHLDWYEGNAARQIAQPEWIEETQPAHSSNQRQVSGYFLQKGINLLLVGVFLLSLFANLFLQWQTIQINQRMSEYSANQIQLDEEMNIMLNEIAQSFDYDRIKLVAQEQGMEQVRERVKEISQ